jgi:hypothetical protein
MIVNLLHRIFCALSEMYGLYKIHMVLLSVFFVPLALFLLLGDRGRFCSENVVCAHGYVVAW